MVHRRRGIAALVLLAALTGACGSGPAATSTGRPGGSAAATAPPASPPPTAGPSAAGTVAPSAAATPLPPIASASCGWITADEMTAILVGKVVRPHVSSTDPTSCSWSSSDFTVHINLHEDQVSTITALRLADRNIEELSIGEGGVFSRVSRGAYLVKGNRVLAVQVVMVPTGLEVRDVAVAVATAALPRF